VRSGAGSMLCAANAGRSVVWQKSQRPTANLRLN
jgi:hypothetical protein